MMKRNLKYSVLSFIVLILVVAGIVFLIAYDRILKPNTNTRIEESVSFRIPTGSDYMDVLHILVSENIIKDTASFNWVALKKNYAHHIKPGNYRITRNMNNNEIINMLRSGDQEPVKLIINSTRTLEKLASVVSSQIEADSAEIIRLMHDAQYLSEFNLTPETAIGIIIPNTYEFYWNTGADKFIRRMADEYEKFWTDSRKKKADQVGLTPLEVITLASIVDEETLMKDEEPRIAGVYINRLNKPMRLQACPTIKFVTGDWSMTRVLDKHLTLDSPYNTYRHDGLPPGPITIPSISSIDAVLNYEHHDYLFFAAKEDFSGYHNFAKTLAQHNRNADLYQRALDQRNIMK
jgi:UPF0755 protein